MAGVGLWLGTEWGRAVRRAWGPDADEATEAARETGLQPEMYAQAMAAAAYKEELADWDSASEGRRLGRSMPEHFSRMRSVEQLGEALQTRPTT